VIKRIIVVLLGIVLLLAAIVTVNTLRERLSPVGYVAAVLVDEQAVAPASSHPGRPALIQTLSSQRTPP